MIDIRGLINTIRTAIYGKDIRSAIADAFENLDGRTDLKEEKNSKGVADGYAALDSNAKVPLSQINDSLFMHTETSISATVRTVTIPNVVSMDDIQDVPLHIMSKASGTAAQTTLNINGLGAKPLYFPKLNDGGISTTPLQYWVRASQPYCVVWDGTRLTVQAQSRSNNTTQRRGAVRR